MKTLCLIFCLLLGFSAFSQQKYEVGITSGVSVSDVNGNIIDRGASGTPLISSFTPIIILRESEERKRNDFFFGLTVTRHFTKSISVSLQINKMRSGTDFSETFTGTLGSTLFPGTELEITNITVQTFTNEVINIPVVFNYTIGGKYKAVFSGGVYYNMITESEYHGFFSSNFDGTVSDQRLLYDLKPEINNSFLGGTIRVGGKFPVTERISGMLSGFFNHDFTFIDKKENRDDNNVKYSRLKSYGLALSASYSF